MLSFEDPDGVQLPGTTGSDLRDAGQLDTARPLLDRAADIAQENLGPDHPYTFATRSHLARWLGMAGQAHSQVETPSVVIAVYDPKQDLLIPAFRSRSINQRTSRPPTPRRRNFGATQTASMYRLSGHSVSWLDRAGPRVRA